MRDEARTQPCTAAHVQAGCGQTAQPPHTTTGRLTVETATFQTPIRGADMLLLVFSLSRHKKSEIYVHCQLLLCRPQPSQERSTPQLITFTKTNISSTERPIPLFEMEMCQTPPDRRASSQVKGRLWVGGGRGGESGARGQGGRRCLQQSCWEPR